MSGGSDHVDADELEDLLSSQLVAKPRNSQLRDKLLRFYMQHNRVNEAYEHLLQVEKRVPFPDDVNWYRCVLDVLQVVTESIIITIVLSFKF